SASRSAASAPSSSTTSCGPPPAVVVPSRRPPPPNPTPSTPERRRQAPAVGVVGVGGDHRATGHPARGDTVVTRRQRQRRAADDHGDAGAAHGRIGQGDAHPATAVSSDRKSTRLNSSHVKISYAVFCLKKKSRNT